jgi:hypothetical protein
MAVSTTYQPLVFSGNGSTTAFSITWQFFDSDDLTVIAIDGDGVETVQTITTHYTVSGGTDANGLPATGTVTMITAPASGTTLRVERNTDRLQSTTWTQSGPFQAKSVEAGLDRVTLIAQESSGGNSGLTPAIDGDALLLETSGATDYYDAGAYPVRTSATPSDGDDLVNKTYADTLIDAGLAILSDTQDEAATAVSAAASATSSASAASAAQSAAEAALDSFDDRYLGAKSSAPVLDNDGDALVAGQIYYDTVTNKLRVYSGVAWADTVSTSAITAGSTDTLTNKTVDLTDNTVTGTVAEFDAACSDDNFLFASDVLDEDDFATDSATKAPSQQSTKAYLTARLARGDAAQSLSETYKAQIRANAETASFAAMAHANALVNPSMAVSQEHGGSAVAPGNYAADQWIGSHGTTGGFAATFQRITDGSLPHSPHYIRMLVTSPAPSPGWLTLYQPLEGTRLANFECGTASAGEATVGVWMRSSVVGAQLSPVIKDPTAAHSASTTFTIASANTWEWHTGVISLPTTGTWPRDITRGGIFDLYHPPTGSPIYNVSGATLDVSSPILLRGRHTITANMSKSLLRPYGEELNICQWYWRSSYPIGTQPGTVTSSQLGRTVEGTQPYVTIGHVDIVMRVNNPTVTVYSPNSGTSGKAYANSGADVNAIGAASGNIINFYVNNVSVSAGTGISVHFVANARM